MQHDAGPAPEPYQKQVNGHWVWVREDAQGNVVAIADKREDVVAPADEPPPE
jgi:hypothetical protein